MFKAETILEMLYERVALTPHGTALYSLRENKWVVITWSEYLHNVSRLAIGFRELGLKAGNRIGIMAKTSQDWEYVQMAILMNRGVVVGIDTHDTLENIDIISRQSGITGMVVEHSNLVEKLPTAVRNRLTFIVIMDSIKSDDLPTLEKILSRTPMDAKPRNLSRPEDPATIIFTSGTTGLPKGIQYSQSQMILACNAIVNTFQVIQEGWHLVCWLPLSNLFQRMLNLCAMRTGAETFIVENPKDIITHLPTINPHVFIGVPRFYEKLYEGMLQKIHEKGKVSHIMFNTAMYFANLHVRAIRERRKPSKAISLLHSILDKIILSRLRAVMGTNMQFMVSGSAPMPHWLLEKYHAIGLLILEAYGISENIIPLAMNTPQAFRFGSVGRPLKENTLHIAEDGEILIKGPGVCTSYYISEDAPGIAEKSVTLDGYLLTGDQGVIDQDGFLFLTGRKSEIFKTSTGRRISPVRIEEQLRKSKYVEHAMIVGQGRKCLVAVVSLSDAGKIYLNNNPHTSTSIQDSNRYKNSIENVISDISTQINRLPSYQKPAGLVITTKLFSIQGKELTSNLKMKRKNIINTYLNVIDALYEIIENNEKQTLKIHSNNITLVKL